MERCRKKPTTEVSLLFKFLFLRNGKYRLDNYLSICSQIHQSRMCVFSVKALAGKRFSYNNGMAGLHNSYPHIVAALKALLELVYLLVWYDRGIFKCFTKH